MSGPNEPPDQSDLGQEEKKTQWAKSRRRISDSATHKLKLAHYHAPYIKILPIECEHARRSDGGTDGVLFHRDLSLAAKKNFFLFIFSSSIYI